MYMYVLSLMIQDWATMIPPQPNFQLARTPPMKRNDGVKVNVSLVLCLVVPAWVHSCSKS